MILALLIISILLFCWSVWQSGKIPEHTYEEDKEDKVEIKKEEPTPVMVDFFDSIKNDDDDQDPPTVVMVRK